MWPPNPATTAPIRTVRRYRWTGFTIGITAARRSEEFGALLNRRGADVLSAPTIIDRAAGRRSALAEVTEEIIADPPDLMVATTGIGFRGWVEAAEGWGNAEGLLAALGRSRLIARGPKARAPSAPPA